MTERERIEEHFARGRALGDAMTSAADEPAQVYRPALNALDTADLPVVQRDAGQVALLMGIVSACAKRIFDNRLRSAESGGHIDAEIGDN